MKVKYIGASDDQVAWGNCADPRPVLIIGEEYELDDVDVRSWHTKFYLDGFDGGFNSCCFEYSEDDYELFIEDMSWDEISHKHDFEDD